VEESVFCGSVGVRWADEEARRRSSCFEVFHYTCLPAGDCAVWHCRQCTQGYMRPPRYLLQCVSIGSTTSSYSQVGRCFLLMRYGFGEDELRGC